MEGEILRISVVIVVFILIGGPLLLIFFAFAGDVFSVFIRKTKELPITSEEILKRRKGLEAKIGVVHEEELDVPTEELIEENLIPSPKVEGYIKPRCAIRIDYPPVKTVKHGFEYVAYVPYVPMRTVNDPRSKYRQLVYGFKDGIDTDMAGRNLSPCVIRDLGIESNESEWTLRVIPASTKERTSTRFRLFCEVFAKTTGVNNGYSIITRVRDGDPIHLFGGVLELDSLGFLNVEGLRIILFDDVITSGRSFASIASHLMGLGAKEVKGAFLAYTI